MSEEKPDFKKKAEELMNLADQNIPDFMKTGEQDQMIAGAVTIGRVAASFFNGCLHEGLTDEQASMLTLHFLFTQARSADEDAGE